MIVPPVSRKVAVIKDDDEVSIKKKTWKPRIERVNEDILKHGDFTKLNKFYDLYGSFDRLNFENAMITHMIVIDKKLSTIHGKIPEDLYNRLVNRKQRAQEEDIKMREHVIRQFCEVEDEDHLKRFLKSLGNLLRTKRRTILIMGGKKEEVQKETEQAVMQFLADIVAGKHVESDPQQKQSEESHAEEVGIEEVPSSSHINIGKESMDIEGTKVTLESNDAVFHDLGNIVDNLALEEQEKITELEKDTEAVEAPAVLESVLAKQTVKGKQILIEVTTPSAPDSKKRQIGSIFEDLGKEVEDDDQLEFITSLNKIIGKNKKVKDLEGKIRVLTEKLESVINTKVFESDPLEKAKIVINSCDSKFSNLKDVARIKVQEAFEAEMQQNLSVNIQNDIGNLDVCIKNLRKHFEIGKSLYIQCTKSEILTVEEDKKIREKIDAITSETNTLSSPNVKISSIEKNIRKLNDEIKMLAKEKNRKMLRINILREHISIKTSIVEDQIE